MSGPAPPGGLTPIRGSTDTRGNRPSLVRAIPSEMPLLQALKALDLGFRGWLLPGSRLGFIEPGGIIAPRSPSPLRSCRRSNLPGCGFHTHSGLARSSHAAPANIRSPSTPSTTPKGVQPRAVSMLSSLPLGRRDTRSEWDPQADSQSAHPLARTTSSGLPKLPTSAETAMHRQPVRKHPVCATYNERKGS